MLEVYRWQIGLALITIAVLMALALIYIAFGPVAFGLCVSSVFLLIGGGLMATTEDQDTTDK